MVTKGIAKYGTLYRKIFLTAGNSTQYWCDLRSLWH